MNIQQKYDLISDNIGERYFETFRKKILWEEYTYDAKSKTSQNNIKVKMKVLDSPIKVQIPSKENVRYLHIRNFQDHDLSHNLVLDMIIRNEEFKKYMYDVASIDVKFENLSQESKEKYYKKLQSKIIKKFGFDIKDEMSLISHHPYINEQITNHIENVANEKLILNPPFISDIKSGMKRVIDFYFMKKQLYILIPSTYEKIDDKNLKSMDDKRKLYVKITNRINLRDDYILLSVYEDNPTIFYRLDNYIYILPSAKLNKVDKIDDDFILKNFPLLGIPVTTFGKEKIVSLEEEYFPIEFLDSEFKDSLKEDDIIDPSIRDTIYKSILPDIKFSNSKSVNININPNLSDEELMAQLVKLKDSKSIKSFVEIFNKEIKSIVSLKNTSAISKRKELRNRDYANAFFIYDLYKLIGQEFDKKIQDLYNEVSIQKEKIKNNVQYDKQSKQHEYNKIDEKLSKHLKLFNKTALDKEICDITNIEISKVRKLHSLMNEYIGESKFRNVILA